MNNKDKENDFRTELSFPLYYYSPNRNDDLFFRKEILVVLFILCSFYAKYIF